MKPNDIEHINLTLSLLIIELIICSRQDIHYDFPWVVVMLRLYAGGGVGDCPLASAGCDKMVRLMYHRMTKYVMGRLSRSVTIRVTMETEPW